MRCCHSDIHERGRVSVHDAVMVNEQERCGG